MTRNSFWPLLAVLGLVLAACGQGGEPVTIAITATHTSPPPTATAVAPPAAEATAPATSPPPTPGPTDTPVLPPAPAARGTITADNAWALVEVRRTIVGGNTQDLAWSPAPGGPLAVTESQRLYLFDPETLDPIALPAEIEASGMAFSPDGALLGVMRYVDVSAVEIDVWRAADWTLVHTIEGHPNLITDLAFSPDGRLLASASMDLSARVWDVGGGRLVHELAPRYEGMPQAPVLSVAWHPDGTQLVTGAYGGWVHVWDMATWAELLRFQASSLPQPNEVYVLPDGRFVTLNGYAATTWGADGTREVRIESEWGFYGGDVSPDGGLLASRSREGVEIWGLEYVEVARRMAVGSVQKVRFAPDGTMMATLEGEADLLRLWALGEGADAAPTRDRYAQSEPVK